MREVADHEPDARIALVGASLNEHFGGTYMAYLSFEAPAETYAPEAFLADFRQQHVLLGFVEAVDFVHEENGMSLPLAPLVLRLAKNLTDLLSFKPVGAHQLLFTHWDAGYRFDPLGVMAVITPWAGGDAIQDWQWIRTNLGGQASIAGQGPLLRLDASDREWASSEIVAAVRAMRETVD
mgnify:CR=1 FL=1